MKKIFALSLIIGVFAIGSAQKKYKRADEYFDRMWYKEAAQEYELSIKEGDRSKEVFQKAGDAYYFNTDMEGAKRWYELLVSEYPEDLEYEYLFRYAHSLQGVGNNKLAKKWMKKISSQAKVEDSRTEKYSQNNPTLDQVLAMEPRFTLQNLSINTENSDFGPAYYNDELIYASAIDSSNFHSRKYLWNEQPFLNLYLGRINPLKTDVTLIEEFSKELNSKYHEATVAFSLDEKKIYFTRNNYNGDLKRDNEGINHLKLYSAIAETNEKRKIKWTQITELPFNSDNYSVGHPALSPDGKKLYFTSDMPGSIGATDIFFVDILGNNQYSKPKNLGPTINTFGREMFPFITEDALYFASDGHLGLGGLDVFSSEYKYESFDTSKNLGAPLNSNLDDFGFIIKEASNTGFVCSNRTTGQGDDDIYSFERLPIKNCIQSITGYISNKDTGERITGASLALLSKDGEVLENKQTGMSGKYRFNYALDCNAEYQIKAEKTGYDANQKTILTPEHNGETSVPLELATVNELIIEEAGVLKIKIGIIYFDLDTSFIRNDAAIELNKIVLLMQQYPKMIIKVESHTDSRSPDDYNLALSDRRANATKDYLISQGISSDRIKEAKGYGETQLINDCSNGIPCSEVNHQLNRRSEFIIIKM